MIILTLLLDWCGETIARMILNGVDFDVLSLPPPFSHNCEFSEGDKQGKVIKWG